MITLLESVFLYQGAFSFYCRFDFGQFLLQHFQDSRTSYCAYQVDASLLGLVHVFENRIVHDLGCARSFLEV